MNQRYLFLLSVQIESLPIQFEEFYFVPPFFDFTYNFISIQLLDNAFVFFCFKKGESEWILIKRHLTFQKKQFIGLIHTRCGLKSYIPDTIINIGKLKSKAFVFREENYKFRFSVWFCLTLCLCRRQSSLILREYLSFLIQLSYNFQTSECNFHTCCNFF